MAVKSYQLSVVSNQKPEASGPSTSCIRRTAPDKQWSIYAQQQPDDAAQSMGVHCEYGCPHFAGLGGRHEASAKIVSVNSHWSRCGLNADNSLDSSVHDLILQPQAFLADLAHILLGDVS